MKKNVLIAVFCLFAAPTHASIQSIYNGIYNRVANTIEGSKCQRYKSKHPLLMSELYSIAHPILQNAEPSNPIVSFSDAPEGNQNYTQISGKSGLSITAITKNDQALNANQKQTTTMALEKQLANLILQRNCKAPSHFNCQVANLFELSHGLGKVQYGYTVQCHWL